MVSDYRCLERGFLIFRFKWLLVLESIHVIGNIFKFLMFFSVILTHYLVLISVTVLCKITKYIHVYITIHVLGMLTYVVYKMF